MDTVGKHFGFLAFGHAAYLLGYSTVGKQHEFFYQLVGILRYLEVDADGFAFLVYLELHFVAVEVDGACLEAVFAEYLGELVQLKHFFLEVSPSGFDNLLGFFVGEAAVALDDRMYYARVLHFSLLRDFEDDGVGQFFFVGAEGADEVAEPFGQHGDGAVYQINGCCALFGFLVDDASFFHVVGDVGNVYAYFPKAVFQPSDGEGVVKVLGILGVDGEGGDAAEVFALGYFFGGDFGRNLVGGFLYGGGVDVGQAELGEDGVHLGGIVSGTAQDVDHLADGVLGFIGPFYYFDDGFVACLSAFQLFFGDKDIVGERTVLRNEEGVRFGYFERAYKGVVGSFQYFDYFAFGFASAAFGVEGDAHTVVVHGVCRVAFGDEYRVAAAFGDEGVLSVALALEGAGHFYAVVVELVFIFIYFRDVVVHREFGQDVHA